MNAATRSLIVLAFVTSVAGCATSRHDPTSPVTNGTRASLAPGVQVRSGGRWDSDVDWSTFYPLTRGHTSHAVSAVRYTSIPADGSPRTVIEIVYTQAIQIVGEEAAWNGDLYRVEQTTWGGFPVTSTVLYRQTVEGLFELDPRIRRSAAAMATAAAGRSSIPFADAVGRQSDDAWSRFLARVPAAQREAHARAYAALRASIVAAGSGYGARPDWRGTSTLSPPPEGELTRLRYPLDAGTPWIVRDVPRSTSWVETRQMADRLGLDAAPGWRIRTTSELEGPHDVARQWYGTDGLLKATSHVESAITDLSGNVTGTLLYDLLMQQSAD